MSIVMATAVGVSAGVTKDNQAQINAIYREASSNGGAAYHGFTKTYEPLDSESGLRLPEQKVEVQRVAAEELARARSLWRRMWDINRTRDEGNTVARGDVIVDNVTILAQVPVTHLLFLEHQLTNVVSLLKAMPTRPLGIVWHNHDREGMSEGTPVETQRHGKKVHYEIAPATDRHQSTLLAQHNEDVPVGTWTHTDYTGAMKHGERQMMLDRATKLLDAIKAARIAANSVTVEEFSESAVLDGYVFDGRLPGK